MDRDVKIMQYPNGRWAVDIFQVPYLDRDGITVPGWWDLNDRDFIERCTFATRDEAEEAYALWLLLQQAIE